MAVRLTPPIRLRQLDEAFVIEDGAGQAVAYLYFDDDDARRRASKRLTKADALEAAKVIAAAIRENLSNGGGAPRGSV
jgi:hypothetical protein